MYTADAPMTVVETVQFLKDARTLMSDLEREELVVFVGANPEAGEIIRETGGVRKIRWALAGRGKRGGARVIYYYRDERLPDSSSSTIFAWRGRPSRRKLSAP
jgi:hypothetical protein